MARWKWLRAQWDRTTAAVVVAAGMLAVLLGWLGAKDTPYPAEQIPYVISGAIFGVILVGLGATFWLSSDLRDEWRKLDRLEEILVLAAGTAPEVPDSSVDGPASAAALEPSVQLQGSRS